MDMLSKIDQELHFAQTALGLRARRQEVIASNLANSDTPNYKARDLDFSSALQSALGDSSGTLALTTTSPGHIAGLGGVGAAANAPLLYRSSLQPSLDGNTVDPDVERANFADNAMHYQFLIESMTSTFHKLSLAVSSDK
jgi:flagellar basal-body rod protein FlgB